MHPQTSPQLAILVVDDEPSILQIIADSLELVGFAVTTAVDAVEGLRLFDQHAYAVVVSDRKMPDMSGDEFASAIKTRSPSTPVLLISGSCSGFIDVTRFDAFLPKPFTRTQLVAAIQDLLPFQPQ
jgi:CheY-like chemotaxis protein